MYEIWDSFIGARPVGLPFVDFSPQHWSVLLFIASGTILTLALLGRAGERTNRLARRCAAIFAIVLELLFHYWHWRIGNYSFVKHLPFEFCTITEMLAAALLLFPNRYWARILYFWAFTTALQSLITPDFEFQYNFPHYRFWSYFAGHAGIIWAACYFVFVMKIRPTWCSLWQALLWLNIAAAVIGIINIITGGNYMLLCAKPHVGSLLDIFGPWPWYIAGSELLALLMFLMLYLPFAVAGWIKKKRTAGGQNS